MVKRAGLTLAIILTTALIVGLSYFGPRMKPIRHGTSAWFWAFACGVELDPSIPSLFWGSTRMRNGEFFYEVQNLDNSVLYEITKIEAMADYPRVLQIMEARVAKNSPDDVVKAGYLAWLALDSTHRNGVEGLIAKIHEARLARLRNADPNFYNMSALNDYLLDRRLLQASWYWANFAFEFLFLGGLVWFACWPAIWGLKPWRWAIHLGLLPLLFMLPVYLGYATYTFTGVGPSGGVLYPWLARFRVGGRMNGLDLVILGRLPQILEPLSQSIGTPMAVTGQGMPGPTSQCLLGAVIAIVILVIGWRIKRKNVVPLGAKVH